MMLIAHSLETIMRVYVFNFVNFCLGLISMEMRVRRPGIIGVLSNDLEGIIYAINIVPSVPTRIGIEVVLFLTHLFHVTADNPLFQR